MSLLVNWLESLHEDTVISSKCSRVRNRKSTCSYCMEQCKFEAMKLKDNLIFIDTDQCTLCGECIIACPLTAIEGLVLSRSFDKGSLIYDGSYLPTMKELLIYKKRGLTSIQVNNDQINQEWRSLLDKVNVQLSLLNESQIDVVNKEDNDYLSRRAFLNFFQNNGKKLARSMAPAAWKTEMDDWKLQKYYPDFQFYYVDLDLRKCTLCRACFTLCTERVFTFRDGFLQIQNEKCVNCTSCIDVCTEEAIKIIPEVKRTEERIESYYVKICNECGHDYFTFQLETAECPICIDRDPEWLCPY